MVSKLKGQRKSRDTIHGHPTQITPQSQSSKGPQKLQLCPLEDNRFHPPSWLWGKEPYSTHLASKVVRSEPSLAAQRINKGMVQAMTKRTRKVRILLQHEPPWPFLTERVNSLKRNTYTKGKLLTKSHQNGWLKKRSLNWPQSIWSINSLPHSDGQLQTTTRVQTRSSNFQEIHAEDSPIQSYWGQSQNNQHNKILLEIHIREKGGKKSTTSLKSI